MSFQSLLAQGLLSRVILHVSKPGYWYEVQQIMTLLAVNRTFNSTVMELRTRMARWIITPVITPFCMTLIFCHHGPFQLQIDFSSDHDPVAYSERAVAAAVIAASAGPQPPEIGTLSWSNLRVLQRGSQVLEHCQALRELSITSTQLDWDEGLYPWHSDRLEVIRMAGCIPLPPPHHYHSLRKLALSGVTDAILGPIRLVNETLRKLPRLEVLEIANVSFQRDHPFGALTPDQYADDMFNFGDGVDWVGEIELEHLVELTLTVVPVDFIHDIVPRLKCPRVSQLSILGVAATAKQGLDLTLDMLKAGLARAQQITFEWKYGPAGEFELWLRGPGMSLAMRWDPNWPHAWGRIYMMAVMTKFNLTTTLRFAGDDWVCPLEDGAEPAR